MKYTQAIRKHREIQAAIDAGDEEQYARTHEEYDLDEELPFRPSDHLFSIDQDVLIERNSPSNTLPFDVAQEALRNVTRHSRSIWWSERFEESDIRYILLPYRFRIDDRHGPRGILFAVDNGGDTR